MTDAVLWADDDGHESFEYESDMLRTAGFEVAWAQNVADALSILTERPVAAVLLDQMLPVVPIRRQPNDVESWSGCLLLHWLRGIPMPETAPEEARRSFEEIIEQRRPHEHNRTVPVQIVSAYFDEAVAAAIDALGTERIRENEIIAKPVDELLLQEFVDGLKAQRNGA